MFHTKMEEALRRTWKESFADVCIVLEQQQHQIFMTHDGRKHQRSDAVTIDAVDCSAGTQQHPRAATAASLHCRMQGRAAVTP